MSDRDGKQGVRALLRRGQRHVERDEFGGSQDGGLAIINSGGTFHMTSPRTAAALRFVLARVRAGGQEIPERIALTSALRGEGVTFITRSLASVLAYDTERSVAVVDLNWQVPGATTRTGWRRRVQPVDASHPTLADALERDVAVSEIIESTANPRLGLVAAGPLPLSRRPAVAGSKALKDVIDEIGTQFDHLLLDLPPVLASSDAIQLAQFSDVYVLVVLQGVTPEGQVDQATRELAEVESLGVILNGVDSKVPRVLRRLVEA